MIWLQIALGICVELVRAELRRRRIKRAVAKSSLDGTARRA